MVSELQAKVRETENVYIKAVVDYLYNRVNNEFDNEITLNDGTCLFIDKCDDTTYLAYDGNMGFSCGLCDYSVEKVAQVYEMFEQTLNGLKSND